MNNDGPEVMEDPAPRDVQPPVDHDAVAIWLRDLGALAREIGQAAGDGEGADWIMAQKRREL